MVLLKRKDTETETETETESENEIVLPSTISQEKKEKQIIIKRRINLFKTPNELEENEKEDEKKEKEQEKEKKKKKKKKKTKKKKKKVMKEFSKILYVRYAKTFNITQSLLFHVFIIFVGGVLVCG
ncbi:ferm domain-containing [Anaeramoeba flamelloides]|uniref:Ferm domain-containing n=1 Tax=Anaeramoeba flamelloides TaxID=1746091 RepID=A0AAV7ZPE0_9EUKA|nr:ferm domain-containing [Anaeramoeba flamelloides]